MLRSKRLEVVLTLEERKEQEALERMGEARKQVDEHKAQVEHLERYQQEYRNQVRASQQGVVAVARLQAWQAIVAQLDQVIAQRARQVVQAEPEFEGRGAQWEQGWDAR